ncbi:hypothetical protein AYK25_06985 [Thermoplasmatales archaeon SM1-50]|nr:MAG: hypothetical protein AYK25_06985 [Thermoplasmatales archaeon SM1-50]
MVHQDYIEKTIKSLHNEGIIEFIDIIKEYPSLLEETEKAEMHKEASMCANYELRITRLIDILRRTRKTPKGIKSILQPEIPEKKFIKEHSFNELYPRIERTLNEIEKNILNYEEHIKILEEETEKIIHDNQQISFLIDFNLDLSYLNESRNIIIKVGITSDLQTLKEEIKPLDLVELYSKQFGSGKKKGWTIALVSHISEKEKIEKICREKISLFDIKSLSGSPKEVLATLTDKKDKIKKEKKETILKLQTYAENHFHELLALREEVQLEQARKELPKNFTKTNTTYVIKGWVLEKDETKLKSVISTASDDHFVFSSEAPSTNPDNPPIYLDTPRWAKTFRTLLELFATPKYNEIDPAIFMGIFLILFFGIMLGDAGYGLMILFLSIIGFFALSKHSQMIKDWSFLGIWLGLVTTIVGFLTNGFFGDLIPRFIYGNPNQLLYSFTIGGIHLPIDSLRNPLVILIIALLFGLIHLNLGIILAMYQSLKNKKYKLLIKAHFSWILLQIGGGMLIGDLLLHIWTLGIIEFYISVIFIICGLILRFLDAGPLGFFQITGFVGDWLSYARLLALGLATTGMALAFNIVGELFSNIVPIQIIGAILMIVLLIILHTINLGLQALGAGVHSLRLQYVEFFNRFYEGGGRKFSPFMVKRKYTQVEIE